MNKHVLIYFALGLMLANIANAATVYGTVYDLSLKKISNARVEINTVPKQFIIAQNGTYSFNAPNGDYTLKAQLMQKNTAVASVQENITIQQEGLYALDLILFPDVEEGIEDANIDLNANIMNENNKNYTSIIIIIFIILAFIGIIYFVKFKKKNDEYADLEQIIRIIRQENGRTTQKEIRKQVPLSEAKISLMIAELEHKGIVEKIKKGRGNIIILKKK